MRAPRVGRQNFIESYYKNGKFQKFGWIKWIDFFFFSIAKKLDDFPSKKIKYVSIENRERTITKKIIQNEMENAYDITIPLKVDMGTGLNWFEAH